MYCKRYSQDGECWNQWREAQGAIPYVASYKWIPITKADAGWCNHWQLFWETILENELGSRPVCSLILVRVIWWMLANGNGKFSCRKGSEVCKISVGMCKLCWSCHFPCDPIKLLAPISLSSLIGWDINHIMYQFCCNFLWWLKRVVKWLPHGENGISIIMYVRLPIIFKS